VTASDQAHANPDPDSSRPSRSGRLRDTIGWALLAVYVPFGTAGLLYVRDCSHCVGVWLHLLPVAPGFLPTLLIDRTIGRTRWGEQVEYALAGLFTALLVVVLASWLARLGRLGQITLLVLTASLSAVTGLMLAAAVRS
jgi:hypothetical protein